MYLKQTQLPMTLCFLLPSITCFEIAIYKAGLGKSGTENTRNSLHCFQVSCEDGLVESGDSPDVAWSAILKKKHGHSFAKRKKDFAKKSSGLDVRKVSVFVRTSA